MGPKIFPFKSMRKAVKFRVYRLSCSKYLKGCKYLQCSFNSTYDLHDNAGQRIMECVLCRHTLKRGQSMTMHGPSRIIQQMCNLQRSSNLAICNDLN